MGAAMIVLVDSSLAEDSEERRLTLESLTNLPGIEVRVHTIRGARQTLTEIYLIGDTARIEDVVTKVKAAARDAGLSEEIAEPVWRLLIDRCIAYEFGVWDQLRGVRKD